MDRYQEEDLPPGRMPDDHVVVLLFPSESGPGAAELSELNPTPYDTEEEFFAAFKSYLTREIGQP